MVSRQQPQCQQDRGASYWFCEARWSISPIGINGAVGELEKGLKFLGINITNNLILGEWGYSKKKHRYFLGRLSEFGISPTCTHELESILSGCIKACLGIALPKTLRNCTKMVVEHGDSLCACPRGESTVIHYYHYSSKSTIISNHILPGFRMNLP